MDPLNLTYVEELYAGYLQDPASTPPEWQRYFARLTNGEPAERQFQTGPSFPTYSVFNPPTLRRGRLLHHEVSGIAGRQEGVDAMDRN